MFNGEKNLNIEKKGKGRWEGKLGGGGKDRG